MANRVIRWSQHATRKVKVIDIGRDWPNPIPPLLVPNFLLKLNNKDNQSNAHRIFSYQKSDDKGRRQTFQSLDRA